MAVTPHLIDPKYHSLITVYCSLTRTITSKRFDDVKGIWEGTMDDVRDCMGLGTTMSLKLSNRK